MANYDPKLSILKVLDRVKKRDRLEPLVVIFTPGRTNKECFNAHVPELPKIIALQEGQSKRVVGVFNRDVHKDHLFEACKDVFHTIHPGKEFHFKYK